MPSRRIQNEILFMYGTLFANKTVNWTDATNASVVIFKGIAGIFGLE